jgi:hypothetical protein
MNYEYSCPSCGEVAEIGDIEKPRTCHICNIEHNFDRCSDVWCFDKSVKGDHVVFRGNNLRTYIGAIGADKFRLLDDDLMQYLTANNIPFYWE